MNLASGSMLVRNGKGAKWRRTFIGHKAGRALVGYMRHPGDGIRDSAVWLTTWGRRLSYPGLRHVLDRRAKQAGVTVPSLDSYRRAFALLSLRAGADIYSLRRLMGHSELSVLRRYLAQTDDDLRRAHEKAGPVDNML